MPIFSQEVKKNRHMITRNSISLYSLIRSSMGRVYYRMPEVVGSNPRGAAWKMIGFFHNIHSIIFAVIYAPNK